MRTGREAILFGLELHVGRQTRRPGGFDALGRGLERRDRVADLDGNLQPQLFGERRRLAAGALGDGEIGACGPLPDRQAHRETHRGVGETLAEE